MKILFAMAVGLACLGAGAPARADAPPGTEPAQSAGAAVGAPGAGGLVYVIPGEEAATEELLAEIERDPGTRNALRFDAEGLVEETSPGGGTMVDLRGRFQSVVIASFDADGRLRVDHVASRAATPATEAIGPACWETVLAIDEVAP